MDITILHVAECPHLDLALQRLEAALDEVGLHATIRHRLVTTERDAITAGLRGSPTVLIDGRDPFDFDEGMPTAALACRLYRTETGAQGAPSVPMVVEALRAHRHRSPLDRPPSDDLTRQIRWAAFERLRTGHAIAPSDLADLLDAPPEKIATALDDLVRVGLIERDLAGTVIGAHGLTLTETRHHLVLDRIVLHTWCALDAVGVPAALGVDADIATRCGWCDQPLTLTMRAGTAEPVEAVLWLPREPCTNVRQHFCSQANLFCGHNHLDLWRDQAGDPTGDVLTVSEAAALGRAWWRPARPDCCE
jgi:hypothetical protein